MTAYSDDDEGGIKLEMRQRRETSTEEIRKQKAQESSFKKAHNERVISLQLNRKLVRCNK